MSKMYMTFVIIFAIASNIEARMRMHRSSSRGSYSDYEFVRKLEKEKTKIASRNKFFIIPDFYIDYLLIKLGYAYYLV